MAFLRLLRATSTLYQGTPRANCWWTGFTDLGYDPKLGYGLALTGPDGTPTVLVYAFVDDFLIHGPDKATVDRAHYARSSTSRSKWDYYATQRNSTPRRKCNLTSGSFLIPEGFPHSGYLLQSEKRR
jgi:hypothetical protein